MLDTTRSKRALDRLFKRSPVCDLSLLAQTLQTDSRMSVFRRLREIGYFSSYTHAGKFYTLPHIPQFDGNGLWMYQGIGFSTEGTLKSTVVKLIRESSSGYFHIELNKLLGVKVQNTLIKLLREGYVHREYFNELYLYVSPDAVKSEEQMSRRSMEYEEGKKGIESLADTIVIEILIEAIHAASVNVTPLLVSRRLTARGFPIGPEQVSQVFAHYGIDVSKKKRH